MGEFADVGITCDLFCINMCGNEVPCPVATDDKSNSQLHHGPVAFQVNGKWGLRDEAANVIVEPIYDHIGKFRDGLAVYTVDMGEKAGYIDETGKIIWPACK